MLKVERHRLLLDQLHSEQRIIVAEQATRLKVSDQTIRRDLRELEADGWVTAVFGGAVLAEAKRPIDNQVVPISQRTDIEHEAKDRIAEKAAALVKAGDSLIIDAGTTTLALAHALVARGTENLSVVTNSLPIAHICAQLKQSSVFVLGGNLIPNSLSLIGPSTQRDLEVTSADWAFLGTAAIDAEFFTSADPLEAEIKRAMIRSARRSVVLADATKFGMRRVATFAKAKDIYAVYTVSNASASACSALKEAGTSVVHCDET